MIMISTLDILSPVQSYDFHIFRTSYEHPTLLKSRFLEPTTTSLHVLCCHLSGFELLKKLHHGITNSLNNWLKSLLRHGTQQAVCDRVSSPPKQVICPARNSPGDSPVFTLCE